MNPITPIDVVIFLSILVGILLAIGLFEVLFLLVDVRRVVRRVDRMTEQVEGVLLKPLSIADQVLQNIVTLFDKKGEKKKKH